MCCLAAVLLILGPRFGLFLWWLADPVRWNAAFDTVVWPLLGFLFVPWTTLMFLVVFPGGLDTLDWVGLGIAFLADIFSYGGGGYSSRDRMTGYHPNS